MFVWERRLWAEGIRYIAGIDEAGRGPLAGPVVAAAVMFPPGTRIRGVRDSKLLSASEREELFETIISRAVAYGVGIADHQVIDAINILQATYCAMRDAVSKLSIAPEYILVDGNRCCDLGTPLETIVDGDDRCFSVAAASIIAKVTRDRLMVEYDKQYPGYGFAKHKGYATAEHRDAIRRLGLCEIHRRSFTLRSQLDLVFD